MGKQYLAFDLGASSGRGIIGELSDNKLGLTEIHRFPNNQVQLLDHYYWNILGLYGELKTGLANAAKAGYRDLVSMGIDTWGVDFGFVGRGDAVLGNPFCYRDPHTNNMMDKVFEILPARDIYNVTGIQFMQFNSIFQLYSLVRSNHPVLDAAETLLFMPDLLNFMFTGNRVSEYTIASTSQLIDVQTRQWGPDLFQKLNLPMNLMAPIKAPGSLVGTVNDMVCSECNISPLNVVAPASHDTASAIAAVPASGENWAYLSSGTWSLMGIETADPIVNRESLENNYTNEGGVNNTIRFLKNIMGMWLLSCCRAAWEEDGFKTDYSTLLGDAEKSTPFTCVINPDDPSFLNPPNMIKAITDFAVKTNQPAPETPGEFTRCILESLALKYSNVIDTINQMTGKKITTLHIVGGGSQNAVLNQYAANATGIPVLAGPVEATAIGNILVQALADGEIASLSDARAIVRNSFETRVFEPQDVSLWQDACHRYRHLF